MKSKLLSSLFICLLCASIFGCSSSGTSDEFKEVDLITFEEKVESLKNVKQDYNSASVSYYEQNEFGESKSTTGKYVYVDDVWKHEYYLEYGYRPCNILNSSVSKYLDSIKKREDFTNFKYYINSVSLKVCVNTYNEEVEAIFNYCGDFTLFKGWVPVLSSGNKYYNEVFINYYFEEVKVVTADVAFVKDLCFSYVKDKDAYMFAGINQRVKAYTIKIPDTYDDGKHGEKKVYRVDFYSLLNTQSVQSLFLGKYISEISEIPYVTNDSNLSTIYVDEGNETFTSCSEILYSKNEEVLIFCPPAHDGLILLASNTKRIKEYAFLGARRIESVTFNSNLQSIGHHAFVNCSMLFRVDMSDCVVPYFSMAFINCSALQTVYLSKSIRTMSLPFSACSNLKTLYYSGTVLEWKEVENNSHFDKDFLSNNPIVYCSDGQVNLSNTQE